MVANLDDIAAGSDYIGPLLEKATAAGLVADSAGPLTGVPDLPNTALPVLDALQQTVSGATGRRSPEQIMSRLVGRARRASSRAEFEEAAGNVARLVAAHGSPSQVAAEAETILRDSDASLASLYSLKTTIDSITSNGWDESSIQLGPVLREGNGLLYRYRFRVPALTWRFRVRPRWRRSIRRPCKSLWRP